jgi:Lrp/AsnC family transcriptional regulator, leucine-responsive regulatory protein
MLHILDQTDLRILYILQHNARIPNKDIATMIGKSTSRVFERVKRLKQEGFIKQFVAVLDPKLIDKSLIVYALIRLKEHSNKMLLTFEKEINGINEVMEAYHMSGDCDFMLKIAVADMEGYNEFLVKRLSAFNEIRNIKSLFVMRELKMESAYQL